jgi:hypothetical protein
VDANTGAPFLMLKKLEVVMKNVVVCSLVAVLSAVFAPLFDAQAQAGKAPKLRLVCASEDDGSASVTARPFAAMGNSFAYSDSAQTSSSGLQVTIQAEVQKRGVNLLVEQIIVSVSNSQNTIARASVGNIITRKGRTLSLNVASSVMPLDAEGLDCGLTFN